MSSRCEHCNQTGLAVSAMCAHEHLIEVVVCTEHLDYFTSGIGIDDGNIHCPTCAWGVAEDYRHWCFLTLVLGEKERHHQQMIKLLLRFDRSPGVFL